jgi:DNA/RNA endonuclease G (NUC1)
MKIFILLLAFTVLVFANSEFKGCDKIIDKQIYKVCYSYKYKGALFVSYALDGAISQCNQYQKKTIIL